MMSSSLAGLDLTHKPRQSYSHISSEGATLGLSGGIRHGEDRQLTRDKVCVPVRLFVNLAQAGVIWDEGQRLRRCLH